MISKHLQELQLIIDAHSSKYENLLIVGDFNAEPTETEIINFCQIYSMTNLIKEATCYKNPERPTCIDLMLTNKPKCFIKSMIVETGLSDFHKMTITIMRLFFKKQKPNLIKYRDYKYFSNQLFRNDLASEILKKMSKVNYQDNFQKDLTKILDNHAPIKSRSLRANQSPFINKVISKAIMKRSRLRNKYLKNHSHENKMKYNRQRNYCVSLIRKTKKEFFGNIETKDIVNTKRFWQTVKPLFSDKSVSNEKITLIENDNIVSEDLELAEIFNDFFVNIVPSLGIEEYINTIYQDNAPDNLFTILEKYEFHSSITAIRNNCPKDLSFSFSTVDNEYVKSIIKNLDNSKSCQKEDIPVKIIQNNIEIFSPFLCESINHSLQNAYFPNDLKLAEVIPLFKKDSRLEKSNYRPVSILSNFSKIYEICIFEQLSTYFENFLSKFQFGFRKNYSAQQCLMALIDLWKKSVDKNKAFGILLTDLSKAFDCVNHTLLIAKFAAYGLDEISLKFLLSYLKNRTQKVRINNTYSTLKDIKYGVPQGSVLGPLFFNIYICDLFFFINEMAVANYADDTTPYVAKDSISEVIEALENCSQELFLWFRENGMKANSDKSHLILSTDKVCQAIINNDTIYNSKSEKLLGITIDSGLKFDEHLTNLCNKASQKLSALARVSYYMSLQQKRRIMKAFITSQFGYCPLVWMFCSRNTNSRINRIDERSLRIVYNDFTSTFLELLEKDNSVSIHYRNIQVLCTEIFKVKNNLSPDVMNNVFKFKKIEYNIRRKTTFESQNIRTEHFGIETLSYLGSKIWEQVPEDIKFSDSLKVFKQKIKYWKPTFCPCRLCKLYIANLGFL